MVKANLNFLKEELQVFWEISEPLMQFFSFLELSLVGLCFNYFPWKSVLKMLPCFDFDALLMKF